MKAIHEGEHKLAPPHSKHTWPSSPSSAHMCIIMWQAHALSIDLSTACPHFLMRALKEVKFQKTLSVCLMIFVKNCIAQGAMEAHPPNMNFEFHSNRLSFLRSLAWSAKLQAVSRDSLSTGLKNMRPVSFFVAASNSITQKRQLLWLAVLRPTS